MRYNGKWRSLFTGARRKAKSELMKQNPATGVLAYSSRLPMATAVAVAAVVIAGVGATANAQSGATPATPPVVSARPEVQVVVAPMPGGQWTVSEVYSGQVSPVKAKERLTNLIKISHWSAASPFVFEDAMLDVGSFGKSGAVAPPPVMSSVRCTLTGAVVDPARGVIDIAPFLTSLRDLNRVNIVFLSPFPAGTPYHGLQHFDSPQITVDQTGTQGTYLFVANIKDHGAAPLSLTDGSVEFKDTSSTGVNLLPFLVGLAVAVGLLVYYWATRFVGGGSRK